MPRQSDTREKVFVAADELLQQGKKPTQQTVRELIGTGSITTINAALNDWWTTLSERINRKQAHPELPEPVLSAANHLWDQALNYAQLSLRSEREYLENLHKERQSLSDEQEQSYKKRIDQLQQLNEELTRHNREMTESLISAKSSLAETEKSLILSNTRCSDLEREVKQKQLIERQSSNDKSGLFQSAEFNSDELFELKVNLKIKTNEIMELKKALKLRDKEVERLNRELRHQEKQAINQKHQLELVVAQQDARYESTIKALSDCKKSLSLASSQTSGKS